MMKRTFAIVVTAVLICLILITGALADKVVIAIPEDSSGSERALHMLEYYGITEDYASGAGIEIREMERDQLPEAMKDVDYAVIPSQYALGYGLTLMDAFLLERESELAQVLAVKEGNENSDIARILVAALKSEEVWRYISERYDGRAIPAFLDVGDGFDPTVNYSAYAGITISVAASTDNVQILEVAAEILKEKNIKLEIVGVTDLVAPCKAVEDGEIFANLYAHMALIGSLNADNDLHIVPAMQVILLDPMGLYSVKHKNLSPLGID